MRMLVVLGLLCTVAGLSFAGTGSGWQSFGFNGNFQQGAKDAVIHVRDGYLPMSAATEQPREERLPVGTGAVAVFCYIQSAGGKLKPQPSLLPLRGAAVTISGKSITVAGRTDASGYLILALPPGSYDVQLFAFSKKVTVEAGKTALIALRGGKRMVD